MVDSLTHSLPPAFVFSAGLPNAHRIDPQRRISWSGPLGRPTKAPTAAGATRRQLPWLFFRFCPQRPRRAQPGRRCASHSASRQIQPRQLDPMAVRFLLAVALALLLRPGEASVHEYSGLSFANKGNAFILHAGSEGLYAASPANATAEDDEAAAAVADAFIRFDKITFRRPEDAIDSVKEASSAKVQVLLFEIEDREMIGGSAYGGQKAICCTSDLAKLGACTEGSVIYRPSQVNPGWPKLFVASFDGSDLIATLQSRTIPITKTGMYNMYFIHCDASLAGLEIEGKTIWKNPTGYLPGRMAPLKNFFGLMSFAFVILGIYWFYQYMKSWREVLPLQNCITLVITLGMMEMALWYFEYVEFNETGVRPKGITFWAVTFGNVKRTAAEVIVLIVSMGYGVVTPTLGGLTSKVVMLGGTFFLATEILELVENLGAVNDLSGKARLFLVYPVAILDAAFVIWIFISLAKTIGKLQARRLMAKLDIYRKFAIALIVSVLVSVAWIGYEIYSKSTDVFNERWQYAWIIPAFWHVLSFSLLCVICYLWAPSQNSMRFAYDASEFFDRKDNLSLIRPAPSASKNGWSLSSTPDDKAAKNVNTATSFDEDDEENKRE